MAPASRKVRVFRAAAARRAEIIEAAYLCLQQFGYAGLTARRIAEQSGISLGQITYYFRDMREVLVETYRHASGLLLETTRRELEQSSAMPEDRLEAFLKAGISGSMLDPGYLRVRIDLWSAAMTHPEIAAVERELYERYRRELAELIEAVVHARNAVPDEAGLLVDTIMAVLDGVWLDWRRRTNEAAVNNVLRACRMLVDAYAPPTPVSERGT